MVGSSGSRTGFILTNASWTIRATQRSRTHFRSVGTTNHSAFSVLVSLNATSSAFINCGQRLAIFQIASAELPALGRIVDTAL